MPDDSSVPAVCAEFHKKATQRLAEYWANTTGVDPLSDDCTPPKQVETDPVYDSSIGDVNPTLTGWRTTSNGKIRGSVHGHPDHEDGTRIDVMPASSISNENLPEGYLLPSLGNHNYRLGTSESTERKAQRLEDITNPFFKRWRITSRGQFRGDVYDHPEHKDGARITVTSASKSNENILELKGNLLFTLGTHNFCLGRPGFVFCSAEFNKLFAAECEEYTAKLKAKCEEYTDNLTAKRAPPVTGGGRNLCQGNNRESR